MYKLLELREKYKVVYSRYSMYIDAAFKLLIALAGMILINSYIGTMEVLKNPIVVIMVALVGAIVPKTLMVMILILTIVAHVYAIALEPAIIVLILFIVMYLLFFRFTSKESLVLILMPILFMIKIPYLLPVILGLTSTPVSAVSMAFGTLVYFILSYINSNYEQIIEIGSTDGFQVLEMFIENVIANTSLYFCIIAFTAVLIFVYVIRRLSVNYSWIIAVCVGGLVELVLFIVANVVTDMSLVCTMTGTIVGGLISIVIAWFLQFFLHSVDYTKTEKVQFEDDDYYYYVKAVPKVKVKLPQAANTTAKKATVNKATANKATANKASAGKTSAGKAQAGKTQAKIATRDVKAED